VLHGRQDREQQQQELRQALCGDPQVEWTAWGMLPLDRERLEILVARAQEVQEELRQAACDSRKATWRAWVQGETEGSMRNLYKYIKKARPA
jgi:hypothetical protein